jgi:hypothetical protein
MSDPSEEKPESRQSPVGRFIQTYHTFLSTFVIGAAGLIATSIWQYRQSEIARRQAESAEAMAHTNAENQWRIERAEILSKNLQVLASRGGTSADQRYGVLLSLTRGEILDPELAVSYALELGKDNPEYMKSVLSSTTDKDYTQLAHAFAITCEQRYGLARQVELCKNDEFGPRSDAIARLVSDDVVAWLTTGATGSRHADAGAGAIVNPLALLRDERAVQKEPARLAWLFTPALEELYQKRQWGELRKLEAGGSGAHILTALVLAQARTEEMRNASEGDEVEKLHAAERKWLADYVLGAGCDGDCRGRFVEYFLTGFAEARGDYDGVMRRILVRPPADSGPAIGRLHARFARCQVDGADTTAFRDEALVPALGDVLADKKADAAVLDNLVDLMALVPEPTDAVALGAWTAVLGRLQKLHPEKHRKGFVDRRTVADAERRAPPASLRKVTFCKAPDAPEQIDQQPE